MPHGADIQTIEGQRTLVVERKPPLQPKLDGLLGALTHVTYRADFAPAGTSDACQRRDHRFARFREGRHVGTDGIVRDLRLLMCRDCAAVCVRDISFDIFEGPVTDANGRLTGQVDRLPPGRGGPARRDDVLGWYSGARRNQRTYTGG